jgi:predicted branched-subunit amino acid permease
MAPLTLGLLPLGLTIGAGASKAALSPVAGWSVALTLYGGSTQLAAVELLGASSGLIAVLFAIAMTNLRLLLYSNGMRAHWRGTSVRWRLFASYLLVDPMVLVCSTEAGRGGGTAHRRQYYLGAGLALWVPWAIVNGVGYSLGAQLPEVAWAGLLTPMVLTGLVSRAVAGRPAVVAAAVAAVAAVVLHGLPHDLGFIFGGVLGIAVAVRLERRQPGDAPGTAAEAARSEVGGS